MRSKTRRKGAKVLWFGIIIGVLAVCVGCVPFGRMLLFHPTHEPADGVLSPWKVDGEIIGYAREVTEPEAVWLMLHGNAGQASNRDYALGCFSNADGFYVLEYPGYGDRKGKPSQQAFDAAAKAAYETLRAAWPNTPVCVIGESIGSGPSSYLASLPKPPDKVVLVVPYDQLSLVAKDHFPGWMVWLFMKDDWDNIKALSGYKGPVEIYGAREDTIIPISHAKTLAEKTGAKLTIIEGGHNEWSQSRQVEIRY